MQALVSRPFQFSKVSSVINQIKKKDGEATEIAGGGLSAALEIGCRSVAPPGEWLVVVGVSRSSASKYELVLDQLEQGLLRIFARAEIVDDSQGFPPASCKKAWIRALAQALRLGYCSLFIDLNGLAFRGSRLQ